jgi:two-component system cell cycle sensor histidine kinase/response regulator CckA
MTEADEVPTPLDEARMQQMLEHLPSFAVMLDRQRRFVWVNRLDPTLRREQVIGHPVDDFLTSPAVDTAREAIERAFVTGEPTRYEVRGYADGDIEAWYQSTVIPLPPDDGESDGLVMVLSTDVTKQHLAEQALRESERRFRRLTESSPDFIMMVDGDLRITYLNRDPGPESGQSPADIIGRALPELTHNDDRHTVATTVRHVLDTGEPGSYGARGTRDDQYYTCRVIRLSGEGDEPTALIAATDVTQQRRAEAQHAKLEAQLQQAQKLETIGQLAGGVAHDFNNILFVIQNHLEFAREALESNDDPSPELEVIAEAAERAQEMTRSLLTIGRRQARKPRILDLREIIERNAQLLRRTIPESISVEVEVGDEATPVCADPTQIDQVLLNLCLNARDAISGTGTIHLSVARAEHAPRDETGPWLALRVHDTGSGMDEATLARALEPFFTTKPLGKGTGLGLSMVHSLVTQNQGRLELDSTPGEGTTVTLYFPAVAASREAPEDGAARAQAQTGGSETILVAEDDAAVREIVVRVLAKAGYRVLEAEDGQRAVSLFGQQPGAIDLVLLDAVMPALGGKDAYELLVQVRPDVKVLFCSGYAADVLSQDFLDAHNLSVLSKPYRSDTLLETVRRVLGSGHIRAKSSAPEPGSRPETD